MHNYEENPLCLDIPEGNVIAFDFGTHSMGVAVGQRITASANPLCALKVKQGVPQWSEVDALMNEWQPVALVVGIPLNMDSTEQWTTEVARNFAEKLRGRYNKSVFGIDERLTTREARQMVFEQQGYKALEKTLIDSFAAKLILERFLQLPQKTLER